jgi:hypothetical protein
LKSLISLIYINVFTDAQITGWTAPSTISGASGVATDVTKDEDVSVGDVIATFTATPTSGSISSYELLTADTPFAISSPGGSLTLSSALDFESTSSYVIQVKQVSVFYIFSPASSCNVNVIIQLF